MQDTTHHRGALPFVATGLGIIAADQYTKHLAVQFLRPWPGGIPALGRWLWLNYVENRGGAFGILQHHIAVFVATGVAVAVVLGLYWRQIVRLPAWQAIAYGLVLGGTLGNLWDRLHQGYVVDFVDLRWFPVFNVADSAICVGLSLIGIILLQPQSPPGAADSPSPAAGEVNPVVDESNPHGNPSVSAILA